MNIRTRLLAALVLASASAFALACQSGTVGPSLTATVQNLKLEPTVVGVQANQNVCCCNVTGEVTNTSSVGVHVQLVFPATAGDGRALGAAVSIERDLAQSARRAFLAVGIQAACKDVSLAQIDADKRVQVFGLWEPPQ
jgi:hypothetical protein